MGVGKEIKKYITLNGTNINQVAQKADISYNTLYAIVTRDNRNVDLEILKKIATALGVTIYDLDTNINPLTELEQARADFFFGTELSGMGYQIEWDESGALRIVYPDGTLKITKKDIKNLQKESDSFMLFKLQELKKQRIKDFKKKE